MRGSWQPTQPACSPGCRWVNVRIVITAMPFSSSAWNCSGTPAGASNATEPFPSTGTVPTTRLSTSNLTRLEYGTRSVGWGISSLTRSRLIVPRGVSCVL